MILGSDEALGNPLWGLMENYEHDNMDKIPMTPGDWLKTYCNAFG
jgi:hypothetical protein